VNLDPIRCWLREHLGASVNAAFVYGSVAAGRHGPGSDLDCFVLTRGDLGGQDRDQAREGFAALQRTLGFTPDTAYPVELFSVESCRTILSGPVLAAVLEAAATRSIETRTAQSDDVEVLRALLDRRLPVQHSTCLDELTHQAWALVSRRARHEVDLLRALGLDLESTARP
jgi:Nucleotidyltransferase domain